MSVCDSDISYDRTDDDVVGNIFIFISCDFTLSWTIKHGNIERRSQLMTS